MNKKERDLMLISESLKAMAHTDRLSLLILLLQKGEAEFSVTDICSKLKLNQPETSRHLSILKNKGILSYKRAGSNIYYSINKNNIAFNFIENLVQKK